MRPLLLGLGAALLATTPALSADITYPDATTWQTAFDTTAVLTMSGGIGQAMPDYDSDFEGGFGEFNGNARVGGQNYLLEVYTQFNTTPDDGEDDQGSVSGGLGAHFLHRGTNKTYGFVAAFIGSQAEEEDQFHGHGLVGIEAAHDVGNSVWYGQLAYVAPVVGERQETWRGGPLGRLGVRHYMGDDRKFTADFTGGTGNFDDSDPGYFLSWHAAYEHRLAGAFSLGGFYRGTFLMTDADCDCDMSLDHVFGLALSVDVGNQTIRARDEALPFDLPYAALHRAVGWTDEVN